MALYHIVKGFTANSLAVGENEADLGLVPVENATSTAAVHGEPATLPCAPYVGQLVFDGRSYGAQKGEQYSSP
jgi:hypothetical protein